MLIFCSQYSCRPMRPTDGPTTGCRGSGRLHNWGSSLCAREPCLFLVWRSARSVPVLPGSAFLLGATGGTMLGSHSQSNVFRRRPSCGWVISRIPAHIWVCWENTRERNTGSPGEQGVFTFSFVSAAELRLGRQTSIYIIVCPKARCAPEIFSLPSVLQFYTSLFF